MPESTLEKDVDKLEEQYLQTVQRLARLELGQEHIAQCTREIHKLLKEHCDTSPCDSCRNKSEIEKLKFNMRIVNWLGGTVVGAMIIQGISYLFQLFKHTPTDISH